MFDNGAPYGADTNFVPARQIYPTAGGGNLGTLASASSPDSVMYDSSGATPTATPTVVAGAAAIGPQGNPLAWWTGILIVVGLLLFTARKTGDAGDFANLRASTYNVALITFISVLGITFLKIVSARVRNVPGLGGFATIVAAV